MADALVQVLKNMDKHLAGIERELKTLRGASESAEKRTIDGFLRALGKQP